MGPTLSRYFLLRYLAITAWFFIGVFALVFLVDFTELSRRLSSFPNFSLGSAALISMLRVPMILQQTAPFIGLFSAMAMLVSLNRKYELVVARAAGISAWQFLLPACAGALIFGLAVVLIVNPIAAHGFSASEAREQEMRSGSAADEDGDRTPWLRQHTAADGDTIIGARSVRDGGLTLLSATFLSLDAAGDIAVRRDARRATLRDGYWDLRDVLEYRDGKRSDEIAQMRIATDLKPAYIADKLARPESISVYDLPAQIGVARSYGLRANPFLMQLNSLIATPFLLVAMTLIAATVSMRFARMGQSAALILGGIVAGFLLYVISVLVRTFGNAGFVPPPIAAWAPVVVAMFFGVTFLLYREDG
jgi:lipopolysaccharide export system permease protein